MTQKSSMNSWEFVTMRSANFWYSVNWLSIFIEDLSSAKLFIEKISPLNNNDLRINLEVKSAFYNNCASLYERLGNYDMAISMIDEAIKIDIETNNAISTALDYNNKSVILSNLRQYENAYKLCKKALILYEPIVW